MECTVALWKCPQCQYPERGPFHPDQRYPEAVFQETSSEPNPVYQGVREVFRCAGLDAEHVGKASWNPLKNLIRPGDTVLLKPNLVKESHPHDPRGWIFMLTHGSIIRAAADYIWKALDGRGRIVVADAPQTDSSFREIVRRLQLDVLEEFYRRRGVPFELLDLRKEEWETRGEVVVKRRQLPGDPEGYVAFDLAENSEFQGHTGAGRYYGADYATKEVNRHHDGKRNEYLLSGTAVSCDVFFNLPKMKTHKKAGVTVNLKNLVGVNGDKNWLPHYTEGSPPDGGDQFPGPGLSRALERRSLHLFRRLSLSLPGIGPWLHRHARNAGRRVFGETERVVRSGNWYGNDTVWRMCLDLNKIIMYGQPDGSFRDPKTDRPKRYYCLVDGIIAGQGCGPLSPDPIPCGLIAFGEDPVAVDASCAYLAGFDPGKIPVIGHAFHSRTFPLTRCRMEKITCVSNHGPWDRRLLRISPQETFRFQPHFGWTGHIELDSR